MKINDILTEQGVIVKGATQQLMSQLQKLNAKRLNYPMNKGGKPAFD